MSAEVWGMSMEDFCQYQVRYLNCFRAFGFTEERRQILFTIASEGPISKRRLSLDTNISRSSADNYIQPFLDVGIVTYYARSGLELTPEAKRQLDWFLTETTIVVTGQVKGYSKEFLDVDFKTFPKSPEEEEYIRRISYKPINPL